MPELPDVEVFKQYLDATALHKRIVGVEVQDKRILGNVSVRKLGQALGGNSLEKIRRHGKHLFAQLANGHWLTLHFGMTGDLQYYKLAEEAPEHTRLRLDFDNGYHLAYDCQRLLGKISLLEDIDEFLQQKDIGPDALDEAVDLDFFRKMISGHRGAIKSTLMNQKLLAGLGNVYSDEILYQARVHPGAKANELGNDAIAELFWQMKHVLQMAIARRAQPANFPGSFLLPQRHADGHCPSCEGELVSAKVVGRTSYFCPACQKS